VCVPKTLLDLMKVYQFQMEWTEGHIGKDRFCKCGIESRPWVPRNYGAYFYTRSKEEGLARVVEIRKAMKDIDVDAEVYLKRYCTEFELGLGPSDKYEWPEGTETLEKLILDSFDLNSIENSTLQPKFLKDHVIRKWIEFAWDRGDPTAAYFNDNEPLYPVSVKYEPEEEEE